MTLTETIKADTRAPCDCKSECDTVISAAQKAMADRDALIRDQKSEITDLGISLDTITKDRDSIKDSRDSWYHNPFVLIPIGLLVGGAGALYLDRK